MNKYLLEHAEIDAELLLEGPLCRTNYLAATRDNVAYALLQIVIREKNGRETDRPKLTKTRNGNRKITGDN